jgi:glycosyltransferase involved in cell wall biosynthesis
MYSFAFVMDQQVGLRTHSLSVQAAVGRDRSIRPTWVPVSYDSGRGWLKQTPGIPASLRGTLMGAQEIRRGLAGAGDLQAVLWATWAAKWVPDLVCRVPAFFTLDMTPVQMEQMGEHYGYTRARAQFFGTWKRRATERLYARAVHLFPWSDWVAASLRDDYGVPAEKITPISPGVDLDLYRPDPAARVADRVVRLLFVGGDFARKGGEHLLRWARETRTPSRWELHVVTRDDVPAVPGVVVHRGLSNNSPELVALYRTSDLFVLPTLADCYSLVALEAMACELPVVISSLGGIPEIVQEGKTGHLLAPGDYRGLAACLDRLVGDAELRRSMGQAARRRAVERFDSRRNAAQVLEAMKQVAPQVAGPPGLAERHSGAQ